MSEREGDDVNRAVGAAIRSARQAAGLSMRALSARSGVSQPFLSQAEAGQTRPSLASLYRIAGALGIGPDQLLPPSASVATPGGGVVRSGEGHRLAVLDGGDATTVRALSGANELGLEVYEFDIQPSEAIEEWFEHAGAELVYVLRGKLRVELGDGTVAELSRSDSITYDGRVPHRWLVVGRRPVGLLVVVSSR